MKFNIDDVIPTKTNNWLYAEDIFHSQFNEVFFYVEDKNQEEMYFCILKKLFKDVKFENIFPQGGKENVIKDCKSNINVKNKIYIVDKDFDDILNKIEKIPNLFYLDKYSIENYCYSQEGVVNFIISRRPTLNRNDVKEKLNFGVMENCIINNLKYITLIYLVVQKYLNVLIEKKNSEENCIETLKKITTCNNNVELFLEQTYSFFLSKEKIENYKNGILQKLNKDNIVCSIEKFYEKILVELNCNSIIAIDDKNILGKYYLKLIFNYLKNNYDFIRKSTFEEFTYALVDKSDFNSLSLIKKNIGDYLKK